MEKFTPLDSGMLHSRDFWPKLYGAEFITLHRATDEERSQSISCSIQIHIYFDPVKDVRQMSSCSSMT